MRAAEPPPPRSRIKRAGLILLGTALFAGFAALGTWQVYRLAWKLELIARVDARIHAGPVAPPGRAQWTGVSAKTQEYLRVRASGSYLGDAQTLVHATTRRGRGYWVMTPLQTQSGFVVLINRGFVASNRSGAPTAPVPPPAGRVVVTGLLRLSEPGGRFLRPNDPALGRWVSRDVAAIAAAADLPAADVAPYFIDAGASSAPGAPPVGGLTVVHFRNAHLVYAITWYALAALVVVAAILVARFERRGRRYPRQ